MKKTLVLALLILSALPALSEERIKVGPYAGYFRPSDRLFREIYGNGYVIYGGRVGVRIIQGISAWLSYSRYRAVGETTFTHERTTITLSPVNASVRFNLNIGSFRPYAAAGLTFMSFKEASALGNVKDHGTSFSSDVGFEIRFSQRVFWDVGMRFELIKVRAGSAVDPIDLGGLQFGTSFCVAF